MQKIFKYSQNSLLLTEIQLFKKRSRFKPIFRSRFRVNGVVPLIQ